MEQDDTQLVAAYKAGDKASFDRLYERYVKKIFDYVWYRTFNQNLAEDLTSTVFMKVLDNISGFDPLRGSFKTWIYRITANSLIDYYRTRKIVDPIEAASNVAGTSDPAGDTDLSILSDYARNILKSLPKESRDLVVMRLWDDLSYRDIATLTGKTEAALKMQFSRIINSLRSQQESL